MDDDCCCFLFTSSNHRTRMERRHRAGAQTRSHSATRPVAAHTNRQSYPQAARQPANTTASVYSSGPSNEAARRLECEEIELQCWSLSPDCLLVNSDKRCRLINMCRGQTRTRPLDDFEEGRRHLDVRRPESMSTIKFKIDHQSGQVERRLSIHEIKDEDNEFLDLLCPETPDPDDNYQDIGSDPKAANELEQQQRRRLAMAKKLSSRSFLVIERASINATSADLEQSFKSAHTSATSEQQDGRKVSLWICDNVDGQADGGASNQIHKLPERDSTYDKPVQSELERELISSISIETQPQPKLHYEPAPATPPRAEPKRKRKRKKLRLNIARRIYKLISNSGGHSPSEQQHSSSLAGYSTLAHSACEQEPDSDAAHFRSCDFIGNSYQQVEFDAQNVPQMVEHQPTPPSGDIYGQLVPLARPESVYLWPKRLGGVAEAALDPNQSFASNYSNTSLTNRFNQQQSQHIAMISYNHAEAQEYAIALHARLKGLGVSAYLDLYDIRQGEDWQDSLNFAILNCAVFIALVTPSYGETLWTSRECKLADVLSKRIIPVNFGQRWPPPSLAIQFATRQYIDWLHFDPDSLAAVEPDQKHHRPALEQRGPLSQSHFLLARPAWPAECVLSIAAQVKKSLSFEFENAFQEASVVSSQEGRHQRGPIVELQDSATPSWNSGWSGGGPLASSQPTKPASPPDSGYESPPEKREGRPLIAPVVEADAILNTSIQSNQSASSLGRKLRSLAREAKKSSECPRSYGATELNENSGAISSDEPHSAELICGAPSQNGFRLTRTRAKHEPSKSNARASARQQCDSGRYSANGSSIEQEQAPEAGRKQQEEKKPARKSSLGHKAKKVLSRVKRSITREQCTL